MLDAGPEPLVASVHDAMLHRLSGITVQYVCGDHRLLDAERCTVSYLRLGLEASATFVTHTTIRDKIDGVSGNA